ncbi:methyltransferase type 11 [Candidatus Giovannonibacteria bacterium RIFCSPLOWO2_02_FULL_45_14]|uniref:Methyltransferase type 11 n=1 Tax=Candidatus Giovannonibacteria bacterium RIFCSPLOWO2_12_FULL_44_15 TaxID=1798364 RepID=A0A1F5Y0Z8_9BACT|nr:MAG: methyltransferase type 11 [Candidatus Giovannonibacteria bacterium RIFCSPHIGHO2_02_FULL_44_31]OGF76666.1 MAG: methyltransferase type 11 [Candidatus Giovannonibacteria bacterium RIFCSPHIGHO2_12_FULL_44_29]OGF91240.1 MAG: methyltransferase type 11 [Candidatus Giovannonibacteria bacterium RIFCSPLOWO2_02_FULL_45_14]OGF93752.1 MAG: methyltransferase type 11 [Candidatus Giovannonibacteria bacterium RIFCSPLOWO2_12_FULL_44_15]
MNREKKLNIGCGEFKKNDYINMDWDPRVAPDVVHDLNKFPYPFSDNEFDRIEADHVLEHLEDPLRAMQELHRISENNAIIFIRVPHFSRGFTHPEHKRGFDVTFPYYFNPSFKGGYRGYEFTVKKIKLSWFAQFYLKKTVLSKFAYYMARGIGIILDGLANLSPVICARIWCFWVGGFEEISFEFMVKK